MENRNNQKNIYRKREMSAEKKSNLRLLFICIISIIAVAIIVSLSVSTVNKAVNNETEVVSQDTPEPEPKPAPEIPPATEQNDLLEIAKNAQGREEKACYLTFDDGPTELTNQILDILKQYNVKATFFVLGRMIEANPGIARRVYDEGHLLANHSYSHNYKELYATPESFMGEIERTTELIKNVTGEEPFKLIRFPGGGHNAGDHAEQKQQYKLLLREKGYYFSDWNALNGDAEASGTRTPDQLLSRIRETATQPNIVVLMHDAKAKKTTPEALPSIIEYLKSQGYGFYRLDEIKYYKPGEKPVQNSLIM